MGETLMKQFEGPNPWIAERADPYVMRSEDGMYYFTASYPMRGEADADGYDRVVLRESRTLEGLAAAEEVVIWQASEKTMSHRFIWAPELHCVHGTWVVYYAGSCNKDNRWWIDCHVLVCDGTNPMTGKWTEKGKMQPLPEDAFSFTGFSLDMTWFSTPRQDYVIWAQHSPEKISCLYMAGVDAKEPWKLTTMPMLLSCPTNDWEQQRFAVNEGPAVIQRDGKIIVAFSASGTGPEYCMGALLADEHADLLTQEAWEKLPWPILCSEDLTDEYGPGHNSFVTDAEGNVFVVYHARSRECFEKQCGFGHEDPLYDPCRHARVISWEKLVWKRS